MNGSILCQECGERPATFHMTRVVNNQATDVHLCERCARERGEFEFFLEPKFSLHNLLAGLLEQSVGARTRAPLPPTACPGCGLTYQQFARTGLLGCRQCYDTFAGALEPIVRRVHGHTRHVGKAPAGRPRVAAEGAGRGTAPGRVAEAGAATSSGKEGAAATALRIEQLRRELERAVAEERYEDAARLRDQIRALQGGGGAPGTGGAPGQGAR